MTFSPLLRDEGVFPGGSQLVPSSTSPVPENLLIEQCGLHRWHRGKGNGGSGPGVVGARARFRCLWCSGLGAVVGVLNFDLIPFPSKKHAVRTTQSVFIRLLERHVPGQSVRSVPHAFKAF